MPGAGATAKCGPEVGGTESYRTLSAALTGMCGLSRIGTARPGRPGSFGAMVLSTRREPRAVPWISGQVCTMTALPTTAAQATSSSHQASRAMGRGPVLSTDSHSFGHSDPAAQPTGGPQQRRPEHLGTEEAGNGQTLPERHRQRSAVQDVQQCPADQTERGRDGQSEQDVGQADHAGQVEQAEPASD